MISLYSTKELESKSFPILNLQTRYFPSPFETFHQQAPVSLNLIPIGLKNLTFGADTNQSAPRNWSAGQETETQKVVLAPQLMKTIMPPGCRNPHYSQKLLDFSSDLNDIFSYNTEVVVIFLILSKNKEYYYVNTVSQFVQSLLKNGLILL